MRWHKAVRGGGKNTFWFHVRWRSCVEECAWIVFLFDFTLKRQTLSWLRFNNIVLSFQLPLSEWKWKLNEPRMLFERSENKSEALCQSVYSYWCCTETANMPHIPLSFLTKTQMHRKPLTGAHFPKPPQQICRPDYEKTLSTFMECY